MLIESLSSDPRGQFDKKTYFQPKCLCLKGSQHFLYMMCGKDGSRKTTCLEEEENEICDVFSTHRCCDCFEPTDRLSHRLISSRENLSTSPQCKISFSLAEKGIEWIDDELRSRHHGTVIFVLENS